MPRRILRVLALLWVAASALLAAGAQAQDDPPGRVGRVAEVSGEVRTVNGDGAWITLPRNQPLTTGDRVITDKDGQAVVQVGSSTLRLGAYTDITFTRLDDDVVRIRFVHGQMALRVRSAGVVGEIGVETDEGLWVPRHPGHFRFDRAPNGVIAAQVWSGDLLLQAPDSSLPVTSGQRAEVWREGAQQTTHYRLVATVSDKFSDWALAGDKLDDRYAVAPTAAASAPVPAEMTGAGDLGRYGAWSNSPDYGEVWTPAAVPTGWAPYQDGAWTWVAPWGWTWIDNAPWGFAPFHYGRWAFVRGHWCWIPGSWGPRPIYAPALVGWFGGDGFAFGGVPAIGWVPLAPFEPFYPSYAISPRYWNLINGSAAPLPVRRSPGPAHDHSRFVPIGPVVYANRAVPGALSLVPSTQLGQPRAAVTVPPQDRAVQHRLVGEAKGQPVTATAPPPPPPGRSLPSRAAPQLDVPATPPAAARPASPPPAPTPVGEGTGPVGRPVSPDAAPARPAAPVAPAVGTRAGGGTSRGAPGSRDAP